MCRRLRKFCESRVQLPSCEISWSDVWALFSLMAILISYCTVTYLAFFDNRLTENIVAICVVYGCDILYGIDVIQRIRSCAKSGGSAGRSKMTTRLILFISSTLLVDVLSLVPGELVMFLLFKSWWNPTWMYYFAMLRLNRVLRLYQVVVFYTGKTKDLRLRLYSREIFAILVCFLAFLIALYHGVACLWYGINCEPTWKNSGPICKENITDIGFPGATISGDGGVFLPDHPYYTKSNHTGGDAFGWYVAALHWTVMSLRNSGNRYTPPQGAIDMIITINVMLFGFLMCTIITVFLIYILSEVDLRRSVFFHEAYAVKSFVKHFDMMKSVASFSDSCFNFMWKRKRGYSDQTMKVILPRGVQIEIGMCMVQPMIDASEILKTLSDYQIERIAMAATVKHFFANEFLIRPNTVVRTAFFIVAGKVEVLSEEDEISPIIILSKGSMIGEINLIYPSVRVNGVKTRTPCDIILLHNKDVALILKVHPEAGEQVQNIIRERLQWARQRTREATPVGEQGRGLHDTSYKVDPKWKDRGWWGYVRSRRQVARAVQHRAREDSLSSLFRNSYRIRRATGTQFMSVLAWLSFLKQEKKNNFARDTQEEMYEILSDQNERNASSQRLYTIKEIKDDRLYDLTRCGLSRESWVFMIWDYTIIIAAFGYCISYPIMLMLNSDYISNPINYTADTLFTMDLFLRVFVFREPEEIALRNSFTRHVVNELSDPNILVDIIPILPIFLIGSLMGLRHRTLLYFRVNVCVKFIRVMQLIQKWENDVRVRIFTVRFVKNSLYIILFIFTLASVFTILGCQNYPNCGNGTWVSPLDHTANLSNGGANGYDFSPESDSIFQFALYWATCTTYGIGFNDIVLKTKYETGTHSLGLLLGLFLLMFFWADLASTLSGAEENSINHQDNLIWLTRYLDEALIDLRLIDRVTRYLDVQWQVLRGISSESHRTIGFLMLSHSMYVELLVDYVADYLYRTHLFKYVDTDTMRKFCLAAKLAVVPPNEIIVGHGDFLRRMYVLRRGYIQVYAGESEDIIGTLRPGHSFGEINMLFGIPSPVTLRSMTYIEVIVIDSSAFDRILPTAKFFSQAIQVLKENTAGVKIFQQKLLVSVKDAEGYGKGRQTRIRFPNARPMSVLTHKEYLEQLRAKKDSDLPSMSSFDDPFLKEFRISCCPYSLRYCFLPMTFLPKGRFIHGWEFFRVTVIILCCVIIPLNEAFPSVKNYFGYYMYIFDGISFLDMFIRLHTAYHDSITNELITHPRLAAKHYLATAFLIDFLGSFPVYALIHYTLLDTKWEATVWSYLLRCNRLILSYRVYGYYKSQDLKIFKGNNSWRMMKVFPLLLYVSHFLGCSLAIISCPATQRVPNPRPRCLNDTWISHAKPPGKANVTLTDVDIYIKSIYYVSTTFMGCGFGDYYPYNQMERATKSIFFVLYIFFRAYILANVVGSKGHSDHKLLEYQKQMTYLVGFLRRERLDRKLTSRIIRYYDYQWRRTRGIEPQKLFASLFPSLRKEVAMDAFEDVMRQLPEFRKVPPSFLRAICVYLTPIYFLRNDIIVQKEDVCDYIYFISRGKVSEWRDGNDVSREVGEYIGVMDVFSTRPIYPYTVTAVTNVDAFRIRRKDFARILNFYPAIAQRFSEPERKSVTASVPGDVDDSSSNWNSVMTGYNQGEMELEDDNVVGGGGKTTLEKMSQSMSNMATEIGEMREKRAESTSLAYYPHVPPGPSEAESCLYRYLDRISFVAAVISTMLVTFQFSYRDFSIVLFAIGYTMDIVFIVRMGLSFRISYFDDSGEIVSDSSEIENKYLSDFRGFGLDFLSTFPLEMFVGAVDSGNERWLLWVQLRMNRILRLVHVWIYYQKRTNSLSVHLIRTKLERIVCFTIMYFHFLTCVLHGVSKLGDYVPTSECKKDSKLPHQIKWACAEPARWFQTKNSKEEDSFESHPYVWTLYFVISTFTTTAYGDVLPVTYFELLFITLTAFSSLIWTGLVLSNIISGLHNTIDTSYHLAVDVTLKLYKDYGVYKLVLQKVIRYLTYAWIRNRGVVVPEFLQRAPSCLKIDIFYATYGSHFRQSYLFRNLPEEFLRQLSTRIRHFWVLSGDYVLRQNDVDTHIYFIHRGYVSYTKEVVSETEKLSYITESGELGVSAFFGEVQCIMGPEPHEYSYIAVRNVDIVCLSAMDLKEILEWFPQHKRILIQRVANRHKLRNTNLSESFIDIRGSGTHTAGTSGTG